MRITSYPLALTEYQQLQPLWPGRVLSVGACDYDDRGYELPFDRKHADMWCLDDDANRAGRPVPILGVWMIPSGEQFPPEMAANPANDVIFHGTVDFRPYRPALHVWSAVIGHYEPPEIQTPLGEVSSVEDIMAKLKERHADRRQR